jgi:TPR repeat protein
MRIRHIRSPLLALVVAAAFGTACLPPVQAMTDDQASALARSADRDAAALAQLKDAARNGDANVQYLLGIMYQFGRGVPQDDVQSAFWYSKAAEQGDVRAQTSLGIMYQFGRGVPQDDAQAVFWYSKAAEQGDVRGLFCLAAEYWDGRGVPQDLIIAYALYNLISAAGDQCVNRDSAPDLVRIGQGSACKLAPSARDDLARDMTPHQIAAGQELTRLMMKIGVLKAIDAIHPGSRAR